MTTPSNNDSSATPSAPANMSARFSRGKASRNSKNSNQIQVQSTNGVSFEEARADIGAVAGLRTEKITNKLPFAIFSGKVADYVISNIKYGSDVETFIHRLEDPSDGFEARHKPAPLMVDNPSFDEKYMQQIRFKAYVDR